MRTKTDHVNQSLINFDQLPDTANVRQPVIEALYGCSSATVWRWVKSGIIPKPRKFRNQRITVWNVGELRSSLNVGAFVQSGVQDGKQV